MLPDIVVARGNRALLLVVSNSASPAVGQLRS
jgi:hypothetical protein